MRERNHQLTREDLTASKDLAGEIAAVAESGRAKRRGTRALKPQGSANAPQLQ